MVRRAKAKITALVISAACIIIELCHTFGVFHVEPFGICKGAPLLPRLTYHFFHANLIHAALNAWCLLSLVFIYQTSIAEILLSYAIAASYPIDTLSQVCGYTIATTPTVGLSAVCFSLMGQTFYRVRYKLYYSTCVLSFIALGFILPPICQACGYTIATPNNILHLYCYVVGLIVGFLNSPIPHHAN